MKLILKKAILFLFVFFLSGLVYGEGPSKVGFFRQLLRNLVSTPKKNEPFSCLYVTPVRSDNPMDNVFVWRKSGVMPFKEIIVTWNAERPTVGTFLFFVRVKGNKWSDWLEYAAWGDKGQRSFFSNKDDVGCVASASITLKGGVVASEFEVKVEARGGASIQKIARLYACVSNADKYSEAKPSKKLVDCIVSNVPQQSQMVLNHQRAKDLCSPTATSSVMSYFLGGKFDPVDFAALVYDEGHKIYGNWVLNVAQAYDISGGAVPCCVARLSGFDELHSYLLRACPVIVSVQGPLKGSATPYANGHLIVVVGWDAKNERVWCVDSAFRDNKKTLMWYSSSEFCKAWARRRNLSYVFMPHVKGE